MTFSLIVTSTYGRYLQKFDLLCWVKCMKCKHFLYVYVVCLYFLLFYNRLNKQFDGLKSRRQEVVARWDLQLIDNNIVLQIKFKNMTIQM